MGEKPEEREKERRRKIERKVCVILKNGEKEIKRQRVRKCV